jgi:uncharacterized protein YegP (UPF0339 family)
MQTIEIHTKKPKIGKRRWWNVLLASGNHEPLMSSEMLQSEDAAINNANLVADDRVGVQIVHVKHN